MGALKPPFGSSTPVFVIDGPIERADVTGLCERVSLLLTYSEAKLVICDVASLTHPDATTIDALARLQLTARRLDSQIRLRHACGALQGLLFLVGLSEVLPLSAGSGVEPGRQTKERE
jgi:ABC-type transporter Mla MlaB component